MLQCAINNVKCTLYNIDNTLNPGGTCLYLLVGVKAPNSIMFLIFIHQTCNNVYNVAMCKKQCKMYTVQYGQHP